MSAGQAGGPWRGAAFRAAGIAKQPHPRRRPPPRSPLRALMPEANRYLAEHYRGAFNEEFAVPAAEPGTAFVPFIGPGLADVLCEHHERTVSRDNCVSLEGKRLQIPAQTHRCHFIKARVRVHRYPDGRMAVFHGPRKLAEYESDGALAADDVRTAPACAAVAR